MRVASFSETPGCSLAIRVSRGTLLARMLGWIAGILLAMAAAAFPLSAQSLADSTHDMTTTVGSPTGLAEGFADIKSAGGGVDAPGGTGSIGGKVAVGTIDIVVAVPFVSTFSGRTVALPPAPATSWTVTTGPPRQVVIVQATDDAGAILWQNLFYGVTPSLVNEGIGDGRATNARGISIYPNPDPALTRIAIGGETSTRRSRWTRAPTHSLRAAPAAASSPSTTASAFCCGLTTSTAARSKGVRSPTSASASRAAWTW